MYLAHYSESGDILGFYIQGIHTNILEPTLEISKAEHAEYFEKGQNHKVIDGKWTYVEPGSQAPQVITPALNQDVADLYQAMFNMSAELEALKGGK